MNEELRKKRLYYLYDNIPNLPPAFIVMDTNEFLKLYLCLEKELTYKFNNYKDVTNLDFTAQFNTNYNIRLALIHGLFHHEETLNEILAMIKREIPRVAHKGYSDPTDLTGNLISRNNGQHLDAKCRYLAKEIQKTIGNIIDQQVSDRLNYLKEIQKINQHIPRKTP